MRTIQLLTVALALLGVPVVGLAQKPTQKSGDAPSATVRAAFAKRFPTVKAPKWEKEGADYEAEFKLDGVESSAVFTADGQFKELETEVALTALPAPVLPYIKQHYAGKKVQEAARIEDATGTVTWEAEVGGKDVLFNAAGAFLREAKD